MVEAMSVHVQSNTVLTCHSETTQEIEELDVV